MVCFLALLIFIALAAACWFASVALCRGGTQWPDPAASSRFRTTTAVTIGAVALTSFSPFPAGYLLGLAVWAVAAFAGLGWKTGRAAVLFACLAAGSLITRMIVLGFMEMLS